MADADPDRVEADELQRRPDRQRDTRVPTCNTPAARVQDPDLPNHSQLHLFPSTPVHYRFNAHRPPDFPRMEDLRGWVGVPHDRNHSPIPIPNRERLSPQEIGIYPEPLFMVWHESFRYLQQWAINYPLFTGCPPSLSLTSLQVLWDLNLGNASSNQDLYRHFTWPSPAGIKDWAVINTVTQSTTVSGLQLTQGIDVLVCSAVPGLFDMAPAYYGLREWENMSLNGLKLHTNRPQYPPSFPPLLRWARRVRYERANPLPIPRGQVSDVDNEIMSREIHLRQVAELRQDEETRARSLLGRPGHDEDLA